MNGPGDPITRRRLLVTGAAGGATLLGAGALVRWAPADGRAPASTAARPAPAALRAVAVPPDPGGRPARQHAWNDLLGRDAFGGRAAPRHARLVLLDLAAPPSVAGATRIEAALRRLEATYPAGPRGLLLTVGWSPAWFRRIGATSPVPRPQALSLNELPDLEEPACCLHLAADDDRPLAAAEAAFVRATRGVLVVRDRRAGVNGRGLARREARGLGLPSGGPSRAAPLMMGFRAGQPRAQATEDDVTIDDGPWAGSAAMHVSQVALNLGSWYRDLDDAQRVARMFAPQVTLTEVRRTGGSITLPEATVAETARAHGVVGHKQAAAQARRAGRPVILRRDVSGVVDGQAVTHFVALARSIDDFAATRRAMDAASASAANPAVGAQINNGINEWTSVRSRANFLLPPRSRRTFPGLPGWDRA